VPDLVAIGRKAEVADADSNIRAWPKAGFALLCLLVCAAPNSCMLIQSPRGRWRTAFA